MDVTCLWFCPPISAQAFPHFSSCSGVNWRRGGGGCLFVVSFSSSALLLLLLLFPWRRVVQATLLSLRFSSSSACCSCERARLQDIGLPCDCYRACMLLSSGAWEVVEARCLSFVCHLMCELLLLEPPPLKKKASSCCCCSGEAGGMGLPHCFCLLFAPHARAVVVRAPHPTKKGFKLLLLLLLLLSRYRGDGFAAVFLLCFWS